MNITTSQYVPLHVTHVSLLLQSNVHCKGLCTTTERPFHPVSVLTVSVETERCSVGESTQKKLVLALVVPKSSSSLSPASAASSVLGSITVLKVTTVTPTPTVSIFRRPTLVAVTKASLELMADHVKVRFHECCVCLCFLTCILYGQPDTWCRRNHGSIL